MPVFPRWDPSHGVPCPSSWLRTGRRRRRINQRMARITPAATKQITPAPTNSILSSYSSRKISRYPAWRLANFLMQLFPPDESCPVPRLFEAFQFLANCSTRRRWCSHTSRLCSAAGKTSATTAGPASPSRMAATRDNTETAEGPSFGGFPDGRSVADKAAFSIWYSPTSSTIRKTKAPMAPGTIPNAASRQETPGPRTIGKSTETRSTPRQREELNHYPPRM